MEQIKTVNTGNLELKLLLVMFAIGLGLFINCLFTNRDKEPVVIKIEQTEKF